MMVKRPINPVRPSRDGHQYHEAWLARRALGLIFPQDGLCGIAVEGLGPDDEQHSASALMEVADATFYFGTAPTLSAATRVEVAQFKYSVTGQSKPFRCTDAKKTIGKFVASEADIAKRHGVRGVSKVTYFIHTNRPIAPDFDHALEAMRTGISPTNKGGLEQLRQLHALVPGDADGRRSFAQRLLVVGHGGFLSTVEAANAQVIADWSGASDVQARARLGDLRQLVRTMAGSAGQGGNVIRAVDVLAALGVTNKDELLPTPEAFVSPGKVLERGQLGGFLKGLQTSDRWLVHAAGGVGKTVFAQSLATGLSQLGDQVVLFDCFGGGAYRSPTDNRHKAERGLMHVVNVLAAKGICDPLLPRAAEADATLRTALLRFRQAIATLRRSRPNARLILILDAADNAALLARERGHEAFPRLLFETLNFEPQIDGLVLIATARTERSDIAVGTGKCVRWQLDPFTLPETTEFVLARVAGATPSQIGALHKRTGGNGRITANLIEDGRAFETSRRKVKLDDVLRERIDKAVEQAGLKGESADSVAAFLCAVCVLPPPVPAADLALAFGLALEGVESFASDLWPLVEVTRHGLIFRDEPTETLVRKLYGDRVDLLDDVASRLLQAQATSSYSARSLPALLFAMRATAKLRDLAFDDRFPDELSGQVARRAIRLSRVRTALRAASSEDDRGLSIELMTELAGLVLSDERGEAYLLSNPDLAVGLGNSDDLRRLFEARPGGWRGTRDARLSIAYTAENSLDEAYPHVVNANEWLDWIWRQDDEERRDGTPDIEDAASIAFYLLMKGRVSEFRRYLASWKPFYGYQVAVSALRLCSVSNELGRADNLSEIVAKLANKPSLTLAAALVTALPETPDKALRSAFVGIGPRMGQRIEFPPNDSHTEPDTLQRGLVRCAARMVGMGLRKNAETVLRIAATKRFSLWRLRDDWHVADVTDWLLAAATRAAVSHRAPDVFDCLPEDLWNLVHSDPHPDTDEGQIELLRRRVDEEKEKRKQDASKGPKRLSSEDEYFALDVIRQRLLPLLA